ncbi:MAG TPA: hypothetical protein DEQ28_05100 [Clostridiales bacterium]|nr:hypothetical protein [Clostridiales bacterium]
MRGGWRVLAVAVMLTLVGLAVTGCPVRPAEEARTFRDGVFTAVSDGEPHGYARVTLFIAGDRIVDAQIDEYDGYGLLKQYPLYHALFPLLGEAHATLEDRMEAAGTWDVEAFTGATGTSARVRGAARRALDRALVERPGDGTYFDGTFMGVSDRSGRGWGLAWVTLQDDRITAVRLEQTMPERDAEGEVAVDDWLNALWALADERHPHPPFHEARVAIAEAMVKAQGPQVDAFTGATGSSRAWMQAAERALEAARR